jgi:dTDP-4-dehydrorhamnose reductase
VLTRSPISSLVAAQYLFFFKMFFLFHVTSHFVLRVSWCVSLTTEDIVAKALELFAMQRLCKKISDYVVPPAVLDLCVSLLNLIGYKEVTNLQYAGSFS